MTQEVNHIVGTDLLDYSFKVEQAIKEGWTFSDANEYAPRAWPHMFEAFLVKPSETLSITSGSTSQGVDSQDENKSNTARSKGAGRPAKK